MLPSQRLGLATVCLASLSTATAVPQALQGGEDRAVVQVGSILGKGGRTISEIRRDTGSSIRVLQPGDMQPSAMQADPYAQVVQVGFLTAAPWRLHTLAAHSELAPAYLTIALA